MKGLYSSVNFVTELRVLLYEMEKMWYDVFISKKSGDGL